MVPDEQWRCYISSKPDETGRFCGLVFSAVRGEVLIQEGSIKGYVQRHAGRDRFMRLDDIISANPPRVEFTRLASFCVDVLLPEAKASWALARHPGWELCNYEHQERTTEACSGVPVMVFQTSQTRSMTSSDAAPYGCASVLLL